LREVLLLVQNKVKTGRDNSESEVVREALRLFEERGRVFPTLSRGERVSAMCRRVRGQFTDFGCGFAALRYPLTIESGDDPGYI